MEKEKCIILLLLGMYTHTLSSPCWLFVCGVNKGGDAVNSSVVLSSMVKIVISLLVYGNDHLYCLCRMGVSVYMCVGVWVCFH